MTHVHDHHPIPNPEHRHVADHSDDHDHKNPKHESISMIIFPAEDTFYLHEIRKNHKSRKESEKRIQSFIDNGSLPASLNDARDLYGDNVTVPKFDIHADSTLISVKILGQGLIFSKIQPIDQMSYEFKGKKVDLLKVLGWDDSSLELEIVHENVREIDDHLRSNKHVFDDIPLFLNFYNEEMETSSRLIAHPVPAGPHEHSHKGFHPPLDASYFRPER